DDAEKLAKGLAQNPKLVEELDEAVTRAYTFQSPNTLEGLDYDAAVSRIKTPEHTEAVSRLHDINRVEGVNNARVYSVVGDWADGAEDSIVNEIYDAVDDVTLDRISAQFGLDHKQKGVLKFVVDPDGPDSVYTLEFKSQSVPEVREMLSQAGIDYRSIRDENGKITAIIVDEGGNLANGVDSLR